MNDEDGYYPTIVSIETSKYTVQNNNSNIPKEIK